MLETPAWYIVNCFPGAENVVRQEIERLAVEQGAQDKILQIITPAQENESLNGVEPGPIQSFLFPGILLIQMILTEKTYALLHQVNGVVGFAVQTPLRFEALFPLLQLMQNRRARIIEAFAVGKPVRIMDGPFKGFEARLDQLDIQRSEVRVKIWVFDRETPAVLKFHQIELLDR